MKNGRQLAGGGVAPFDTSIPHVARVYDYLLGGKDNFAADRAAAEQFIAEYPDARAVVRAQRAFLARAVRFLVAGAGVRQFLDVGTGLPSVGNTHEVAPQGATAYIDADLRDTGQILAGAAGVLDFGQPVAVMLLGILHSITDRDDPAAIVTRLLAAVPSGSYLAIAHPASDVVTGQPASESLRRYNQQAAVPIIPRSHAEVSGFFAGLDLVEPGVVQVHRWRTPTGDPGRHRDLADYGGVGRKP